MGSKIGPALLFAVGMFQMSADVLRLPALKAAAAATAASPAPKVFSAVRGLETYSTRFYLEWTEADGRSRSALLTPEIYARMQGPYNRRNIYGAVLAYGPVLAADPRTRPMYSSVITYALCGEAPLFRELGLSSGGKVMDLRVRLEPLPGSNLGELASVLEVDCP
jgi:hypothetical protein